MDQETDTVTPDGEVDPDALPEDPRRGPTTVYYVLKHMPATDSWLKVGETGARSANDAIEKVATEAGRYLAVARRSWREATVEVRTITQATIVS